MSSFREKLISAYQGDLPEMGVVLRSGSINPELPLPPPTLTRQLSGCLLDQVQLILGEDGIIRFFLFATRLRQFLFEWITVTAGMTEDQILADLNVFAVFLMEHRFHWFELINPSNPETARTATRNVLWTLSKNVPGDHSLLKATLRKFSPKRFGYELGPWEHNPNLPEMGDFLETLSMTSPVVGGGGGGSDEPLPENLFDSK